MQNNYFSINQIREYNPSQLVKLAEELSLSLEGVRQKDTLNLIIDHLLKEDKRIEVWGVLEIMNDSYGFLRYQSDSYINLPDNIYVPNNVIKKNNLRTGDSIYGTIRGPNQGEKNYIIQEIISINYEEPSKSKIRNIFENMKALYPTKKINLELKGEKNLRIPDLFSPVGCGQRMLIVAPPKTGKTTLMKNMAHAIIENHPDIHLIIMLIGERPEEVTHIERSVQGAEVVSSTFDEPATQHIHVVNMTLAKAKRLAEIGKDVVILMDSLTRYTRSNNMVIPSSGKILTGGLDANALQAPKKFFGAARDLEGAGSLTIIATLLSETGSKAEEVILEEFKGTGNSEIILERKISEKKIFPAMDIMRSGTRKEELLLDPKTYIRLTLLKKVLSSKTATEAIELLNTKIYLFESNDEFLNSLNKPDPMFNEK